VPLAKTSSFAGMPSLPPKKPHEVVSQIAMSAVPSSGMLIDRAPAAPCR
jgi:hypothetical protein